MDQAPGGQPVVPAAEVAHDLIEALPDAVVVLDAQFRMAWANRRALQALGRTVAEVTGVSALEVLHPDDVELALRSMGTVRSKDVGSAIEVRVRTAEGWRLVELVGAPIEWRDEPAVLLSLRDLTERRRFELAANDDARFRSIVQSAAVVTMLLSPVGIVESVSGALTRQLGHDPEAVEDRPVTELVVEDDRPALAAAIARASRGATATNPVTVTARLRRHGSDAAVPFELTIVSLADDPVLSGFVLTCHDISARVAAEAELHTALSVLSATLDSTADGILVVDVEGHISSYNRRFTAMWRIPQSVLDAGDDAAAIGFVLEQLSKPEAFLAKVEELYANPEAESRDELEFIDGRVFERYSQPQRIDGRIAGRVWSFRDITEQRRLETELMQLALRDPLTGLANRPLFVECVDQGLARIRRGAGPLAVIFLDVDRFKQINDSLGHSAGDLLLEEISLRLRLAVREADQVARFGGDEFAILCQDLDSETDAADIASRVLKAFEEPFLLGTRDVYVNASLGIAHSSSGAVTAEALLQDADAAMYRAKEGGRGRYEVFDQNMRLWVAGRLEFESALRRGIEHDELRVYFQPVVDRRSRQVRGFEALVRWERPGVGLVEPGEFIPLAEETGLVFTIGAWVIRESCRAAAEWARTWPQRRLDVAVNVSSRQLLKGDIVDVVDEALAMSGLEPDRLVLELTETTLIDDAVAAQGLLRELGRRGVRIALDDFGTGYSSLTYLRAFPIDVIKIDESFVRTIDTEHQGLAIVEAVVRLAGNLGIEVVAEGIETPAQLDAVVQLGCDALQGFLFSPPRPGDEVPALVEGPAMARAWARGGAGTLGSR